ncbi:hypothetical protein ABPG74_012431 [Tetrahymena malaccensis]
MQFSPQSSIIQSIDAASQLNNNYPNQDLIEQFQKIEKSFAEFEYSKTSLSCNQLMKRFQLSTEDAIQIKKLMAFSQFQCSFMYKCISQFVDLIKNNNDYESKVYLNVFEKSTCYSHQVIDIKQFQGLKQSSLIDLAEPAQHQDEDSSNQHLSTNPSLQSLQSLDSPLISEESLQTNYSKYGCRIIFKPEPSQLILKNLLKILSKAKNILEIEQELIEFCQDTKSTWLVQVILMVLVLEYINIKESKKAEKILMILIKRYPNNPKYKACLAQIYVQFADLRNLEMVLQTINYNNLTDFKQNLLFSVQSLLVRNHSQFSSKYLDLILLYLPQIFMDQNKSAFSVTSLSEIFGYYRQNAIEMIKIQAFKKHFSDELVFSPINSYLDLYFD